MLSRHNVTLAVAVLGAAFYLIFGLWPLFDPQGFFDKLATFEPYNKHFLHDIGAFQIGIGAALAAAVWKRSDALFAALAGAGVGTAVHAFAHIQDHDLGGKDSDAAVFIVVAIALLGAALGRLAPAGRIARS